MAGMPRMPGVSDLLGLLQQQTEALASLPRTMLDLNRSIISLIDVVASARDTFAASQRVSARLEGIIEELEEPVLALKPGLERLAVILQDPAVDTIPDTLNKINQEVLPLVKGIQDTQTKVHSIATLAEETSTRLAGLPGLSSLLGRRTKTAPTTDPETAAASPASGARSAESSAESADGVDEDTSENDQSTDPSGPGRSPG